MNSRSITPFALLVLLTACGVESAGTAAGVAKLQAQQAHEGKATLDSVKSGLDAAAQAGQERLRQAENPEKPGGEKPGP